VRPWFPTAVETPPASEPAPPAADKPRLRPLPPRAETPFGIPTAPQVAATLRSAVGEPAPPESPAQVSQLMEEMKVIKGLLERQLAGFAWGEMAKESPVKVQLASELLDAGFAGQSARRLVQEMPGDLSLDDGRKWLRAAVNRRLRTLPAEADFVDQGGVYALVGPTGVGKTTTTAKLAARCVVRYGAERLALLTTDGYRIGAHEQLRIYGRILGVPVFVVRDGEDLRRTLADLRDKHMVLIDTVGMSQRDRMVADQAAMLTRSGRVNRLLVLNAGSRGDTLDDVVRAYAGEDLAGCILTKVDEAPSLAPALDCVVRHGLTLAYVANGQRVPEDLHLPNRNYLMHRAFKISPAATAHRLNKDELPLAMPMTSTSYKDQALG
jgi:flagellar biosynthesis protein FlhF